ncbi:unnamed protein product [Paramecium sonneborni]|uniref:Uncharacterized protein n=1 Tax=Paramecium sonneborni TaxID=65129 RepID=A0A8S1RVN9_9CILI|nr:unnamed protein product [Paramecium sonneborni]
MLIQKFFSYQNQNKQIVSFEPSPVIISGGQIPQAIYLISGHYQGNNDIFKILKTI